MNINLSLVGFGVNSVPLDLPTTNGPVTIKTALDAFQVASEYPFSYLVVKSPFRKNVNLVFSLTYKGITLASQLANSVGQEERVWQFYVYDASGMPVPNSTVRIPFDQFELQEGYTVKWRLITVIKQPIQIAKRVRYDTTPEQADALHKTYKLL